MRKPAGDKFLVQMIDKVKNTIQKQGLVYPGEKIIVALSGGPDSVALLDVLAQIAPQMNLQLIVGHFTTDCAGRNRMRMRNIVGGWPKNTGCLFSAEKWIGQKD